MAIQTQEQLTRKLVKQHVDADTGIRMIHFIESDDEFSGEVIRLLEVNDDAIPSGEVISVPHSPSDEIPAYTQVAEVTPDEYHDIQSGTIAMPNGWSLGQNLFTRK